MTAVDVVWACSRTDVPTAGYWDQTLIADLLSDVAWQPVRGWTYRHQIGFDRLGPECGAVVVVPARMEPDCGWLAEQVARLPWALVVLTSDEERQLDWAPLRDLGHPRLAVWVQTPRPYGLDLSADGYLPEGYTPGTREAGAMHNQSERAYRWGFLGQVTHQRRHDLVDELVLREDEGILLETSGFAHGLDRMAYLEQLGDIEVTPSPGGPVCADTFRVWEALELGCVPVLDTEAGERSDQNGYWDLVFPDPPPFPRVADWAELHEWLRIIGADWPFFAARAGAWWLQQKRRLAYDLTGQVAALTGERPAVRGLGDLITVVVPTSPVPANPGFGHVLETLGSLADAGLPDCEVLLTFDGVRDEQAHLRGGYYQAARQLVAHCQQAWPRVLPVVHAGHRHQSGMMRDALDLVRTPLVLYLEHDCPLEPGVLWGEVAALLCAGEADLVRFHHETHVLDVHRHLMVGEPEQVGPLQVWRTRQWSQRPHLARTDYYRRIMADHFTADERWMIEDRMHSVLEQRGDQAEHRVFMYMQPGGPEGIRYSRHLDARGNEPKWVDR